MLVASFILLFLSAGNSLRLSTPVTTKRIIHDFEKKLSCSLLGLSFICIPPVRVRAEPPPLPAQCVSESNPSATIITCRRFGTREGSLLGCLSTENCFSTSAKSGSRYLSPLIYTVDTPENAFEIIKVAAESQGLTVLKEDTNSFYLLTAEKNVPKQPAGSSLFYEFKIRPDDKLVLYRAFVDKSVFLYPLQQPVSDQGALMLRIKGIQEKTGWKTVDQSQNYDMY